MAALKVKDISKIMVESLHMTEANEEKTVYSAIDIAHREMAEMRDWPKLRMKTSLVMAGTDTALPANLIGITGVRSTTQVYFKAEEEDILSADGRPHWYYASQSGNNPSPTQYINITNAAGTADSATIIVNYWAYPDTLTNDDSDIMIPGPRALAMLSIVTLLGLRQHKTTEAEPFRQEYAIALTDLLQRYPATARAKLPRGRHGLPLALGDIG